MAKWQTKRHEQILTQMIAKIVARTKLSDVSDTSVVKHILAAAARQDDENYFEQANLRDLFSIDKAAGDDLDERAKEIQPSVVKRIKAGKAVVSVVFTRRGTVGTTTIPIGTKVKSGSIIFTTTTLGTITGASAQQISGHGVGRDSGLVAAVADVPGLAGNVAALSINKFGQKPAGIDEVTNPSAATNGRNKESDDAFRARLKAFIRSLARCNVSAIEFGLIGQEDPSTSATILVAKVIEDTVRRGNVIVYIDDGTGQITDTVESTGTTLVANLTWNGTTTVTTVSTSGAVVGDYIGLKSDHQLFKVTVVTPGVSFTISNPGSLIIPTGSGANNSQKNPENLTEGLSGPPIDSAVGGESRLFTNNKPIQSDLTFRLVSSTRGILVNGTHYTFNPASGQIDFVPALAAAERVFVEQYTYFTGLIAYAQKIVDGDPNDRVTYPGFRAAGVLVRVLAPLVLLQEVECVVTIIEGFDHVSVKATVAQAIEDFINGLNISADVLRGELIRLIMEVDGVYNVDLITPNHDVIMLDDQIARTASVNVTVT